MKLSKDQIRIALGKKAINRNTSVAISDSRRVIFSVFIKMESCCFTPCFEKV